MTKVRRPRPSPSSFSWEPSLYAELKQTLHEKYSELTPGVGYIKFSLPAHLSPRHESQDRYGIDCSSYNVTPLFGNGKGEDGMRIELMWKIDRISTISDFGGTASAIDTSNKEKADLKDEKSRAVAMTVRMQSHLAATAAGLNSKSDSFVADDVDDSLSDDSEEYAPSEASDTFHLSPSDEPGYLPHARYRSDISTLDASELAALGLRSPFQSVFEPLVQSCAPLRRSVQFVAGVHRSYLYESASGGGLFSLHKEDLMLHSASYCISGQRVWVIVQPGSAERLEAVLRTFLERRADEDIIARPTTCDQWVRHLAIFVSLSFLDRANIEYNVVMQNEGDVILINGDAYHQGFSRGRSLAEAVNLAPAEYDVNEVKAQECYDECGVENPVRKDCLRTRDPTASLEDLPENLMGLYGTWNDLQDSFNLPIYEKINASDSTLSLHQHFLETTATLEEAQLCKIPSNKGEKMKKKGGTGFSHNKKRKNGGMSLAHKKKRKTAAPIKVAESSAAGAA